jgi:hypothetical protein
MFEEPPAGPIRADPKRGGQKTLSCSPKLTMTQGVVAMFALPTRGDEPPPPRLAAQGEYPGPRGRVCARSACVAETHASPPVGPIITR